VTVPPGRLLGVDFGTVRVGLAVCDADRRIASPLETYRRHSPEKDGAFFLKVVAQERIVGLVVGLPIHNDGREGVKAKEARQFGDWLQEITKLPVAYYDERFTTVEAEDALWSAGLTHKQRKERRDRVAAQMMLQGFLEAGCPSEPTGSEGEP
jgi:putative holliday junction resolvase